MATPSPSIFISYAVSDGSDAAQRLRQQLVAEGFGVWQDVQLKGGRDWWSQIEDAIRSHTVEHLLLVMSPEALKRPVVRREIRLAKTLGKQVTPVRSGSELDLSNLPRWLGHVLDPVRLEHWEQLITTLRGPSQQTRMPMMAPEPPADFVARPREFEGLRRQLLDAKGDASVGITAALRGSGGYGKTTLAKALAHDPDIQDAYFDGILWVELGEQGSGRVLALISDLVALITGKAVAIATREAAASALADALGDRRFLLVIDDVWQRVALEPFLQGGRSTTRLITTRFDRELPEVTLRQSVDAMTGNEALALLSWGLHAGDAQTCRSQLLALSAELGEWPQLLKLSNGFLRDRSVKHSQPLAGAIADVLVRLEASGVAAFDDRRANDYDARHRSITTVINTTLGLLDASQRARFGELGIFPEDVEIPVGIVMRLWAGSGQLDAIATEDLLRDLYDLSLLLSVDFDVRTIRIHDTIRSYLRNAAGKSPLIHQQRQMASVLHDIENGSSIPSERHYFYLHYPYHLVEAGQSVELRQRLLSLDWIWDKISSGMMAALVADYDLLRDDPSLGLIKSALQVSPLPSSISKIQVAQQLIGRLFASGDADIEAFISVIHKGFTEPWLCPIVPFQQRAGSALIVTFAAGHTMQITEFVITRDGAIMVSTGYDAKVLVWDVLTGVNRSALPTHGPIMLIGASETLLVSGTLGLWDVVTGEQQESFTFEAMSSTPAVVGRLVAAPDRQRFAAATSSGQIGVWKLGQALPLSTIKKHTENLTFLSFSNDGTLLVSASASPQGLSIVVSESSSGALLWEGTMDVGHHLMAMANDRIVIAAQSAMLAVDARTGTIQQHIKDQVSEKLNALVLSQDGQLAITSGGEDLEQSWHYYRREVPLEPVRIWDLERGQESQTLHGHTNCIKELHATADGGHVLGTDHTGQTIAWEVKTGRQKFTVQHGHATVNKSGRLAATASQGITGDMKIWDLASGQQVVQAPSQSVLELRFTDDERYVVSNSFLTSQVWDVERRVPAAPVERHGWSVPIVSAMLDGRCVATASRDRTARVWNIQTGACLKVLRGYWQEPRSIYLAPDGETVIGNFDDNIYIWSADSAPISFFKNRGRITCLSFDGRLALCSRDGQYTVWDLTTGQSLTTFDGEACGVDAVEPGDGISAQRETEYSSWQLNWQGSALEVPFALDGKGAWASTRDGTRVITGSYDGTVSFFEVNNFDASRKPGMDAGPLLTCVSCNQWTQLDVGHAALKKTAVRGRSPGLVGWFRALRRQTSHEVQNIKVSVQKEQVCRCCGARLVLSDVLSRAVEGLCGARAKFAPRGRTDLLEYPFGSWLDEHRAGGGYTGTCKLCNGHDSDLGHPPVQCPSCRWPGR